MVSQTKLVGRFFIGKSVAFDLLARINYLSEPCVFYLIWTVHGLPLLSLATPKAHKVEALL